MKHIDDIGIETNNHLNCRQLRLKINPGVPLAQKSYNVECLLFSAMGLPFYSCRSEETPIALPLAPITMLVVYCFEK